MNTEICLKSFRFCITKTDKVPFEMPNKNRQIRICRNDSMSETHYNSTTKMLSGFPKIKKLGAVSPNGESTPFVWNNRLMRLELDDATNAVYPDYKTSAVIRDRETGEIISRFGEGCYYFSFYQENGTAYVLGTKSENGMLCRDTILIYESKDLKNWACRPLVTRDGWLLVMFNNSGIERSVEKGEYILPEGTRKVDVRLKNGHNLNVLEGTNDILFENGAYHFELQPGDWFLAEFE